MESASLHRCNQRTQVLPEDSRDYHWASDWRLAVKGAREAQKHALQLRRGGRKPAGLY